MLRVRTTAFRRRGDHRGCISSGLAGPAAALRYGGVRDFVLGARLLDGGAELPSFGGMVMKNVAGYDAARLLAAPWACSA